MIYKNKYEKIIDIINEPYKNEAIKPNFYGRHIFEDSAVILLDLPRKEGAYHGSSIDFRCNRDLCSMTGEIVTNREFEKDVSDKIIENSCIIRKIHQHPERIMYMTPGKQYEKESHIHFTCLNKDYNSTIKIAKLLGRI